MPKYSFYQSCYSKWMLFWAIKYLASNQYESQLWFSSILFLWQYWRIWKPFRLPFPYLVADNFFIVLAFILVNMTIFMTYISQLQSFSVSVFTWVSGINQEYCSIGMSSQLSVSFQIYARVLKNPDKISWDCNPLYIHCSLLESSGIKGDFSVVTVRHGKTLELKL